jgi:hypothetical protein
MILQLEIFHHQVEARDRLGYEPCKSALTEVIISLLDENDNPPYFSPSDYNFSIKESAHYGDVVGSVTAYDDDCPSPFFPIYYIVSGGDDHFSITDKTSGEDMFFFYKFYSIKKIVSIREHFHANPLS